MSIYDIDEKKCIDEYGVDHSGFSLRDEIAYNMQRANEKEQQQCLLPQNHEISRNNNMQNMPTTSWIDVVNAGITGSGEGLLGGINRGINSATFGLYGRAANALFDNVYSNQQNRLQRQAEQVGLGNANKLANRAIDVGSQFLAAKRLGL